VAQVPYQEDTDRRGSAYGSPSLSQRLRALIFPLFNKAGEIALSVANTIWTGIPATNFNYGRGGYGINGVIIHTTVGTMAATDGTFQNPTRQASAHYAVGYDGVEIHQYVQEKDTAWHCGRYYPAAGQPLANVNTVGIEHADNGAYNSPRPDGLYSTSAQLVKEICSRYGIPIDRAHIRKHLEVSEVMTQCPDSLDIDRIVAMANGTWAPAQPITSEDDMLYVGPVHPLSATFKTFAAGTSYRERTATSPAVANLAVGASVAVDAYCYSNSPVNCTDLDGKGTQGPDWLWWRSGGIWVPDAILATTPVVPSAPGANVPASEPLDTLFATQAFVKGLPSADLAPLTARVATLEAKPGVDLGPLTAQVTALEKKVASDPVKPHQHNIGTTGNPV
jgi:hypothetical protein